jgi:hypothetical protein
MLIKKKKKTLLFRERVNPILTISFYSTIMKIQENKGETTTLKTFGVNLYISHITLFKKRIKSRVKVAMFFFCDIIVFRVQND